MILTVRNKRLESMKLARIIRVVAAIALTSACTTHFDSRAASDYAGHPHRVAIRLVNYIVALEPSVMQQFEDTLTHSLEVCGISVVRGLQPVTTATTVANPATDADAELILGSVSYTRGGPGHLVQDEKFEVKFVDLPTRRIVWRGTFSISNAFWPYQPGPEAARDLVARLAADGTLKDCKGTP
jgi:hypothetical protein